MLMAEELKQENLLFNYICPICGIEHQLTYRSYRNAITKKSMCRKCSDILPKHTQKHSENTKNSIRDKKRKIAYKWLYTMLCSQSKYKRNRYKGQWHKEVTLSYEDFVEFTKINKCHYCDKEIKWFPHRSINGVKSPSGYNLDRKDNSLGYTKDNCVVCCFQCNDTKGKHFSYSEMMLLKPSLMLINQMRKVG